MVKRLLFISLATLIAALGSYPGSPVAAQESSGASLEYDGASRTMTFRGWGGRTRMEGYPARNPMSGCTFARLMPDDVRNWIRQKFIDLEGYSDGDPDDPNAEDDLDWFDALARPGTFSTFGENYQKEHVVRFCRSNTRFSPYNWWPISDGNDDPEFELFWDEAYGEIPFPFFTIATAPNAATPFLTNLPVGMKPSIEFVELEGSAAIPGVQTITVTAVPTTIEFRGHGETRECASPFPSDLEMIEELSPSCSITFVEPTPDGRRTPLRLTVTYVLETECIPGCGIANREPSFLTAEIPITVHEARGLRQG